MPRLKTKSRRDLEREISIVSSIIASQYIDELRKIGGCMYGYDQISEIAPMIARETLRIPADGWEGKKYDFEEYVIIQAGKLFKRNGIEV